MRSPSSRIRSLVMWICTPRSGLVTFELLCWLVSGQYHDTLVYHVDDIMILRFCLGEGAFLLAVVEAALRATAGEVVCVEARGTEPGGAVGKYLHGCIGWGKSRGQRGARVGKGDVY
uniref:Uncharacterized protein n=1 Tax=Oryza punctata TaxID=4537 RepID=A0A0E0LWJ1_ORYPU